MSLLVLVWNPRDVYRYNLTAANLIPPDATICAAKKQNSPICLVIGVNVH